MAQGSGVTHSPVQVGPLDMSAAQPDHKTAMDTELHSGPRPTACSPKAAAASVCSQITNLTEDVFSPLLSRTSEDSHPYLRAMPNFSHDSFALSLALKLIYRHKPGVFSNV